MSNVSTMHANVKADAILERFGGGFELIELLILYKLLW